MGLTCPVCGKRECGCGQPITFTYQDGTGPGREGWRSAVRELDPSDSPVVPMANYVRLRATLWETNEALAACQSQAAGRIRELEREIESLRRSLTIEAQRLDWAMRYIPGGVFRRLGVTYSAGADRAAVDAALISANTPALNSGNSQK